MVIPEVGALFEYGLTGIGTEPGRYRVNAYMRVRPWSADAIDMAESGALPDEYGGWLALTIAEIVREGGGPQRPMEFCFAEEATHVSGSGICGVLAPIDKIKVTGMVDWSPEMLERHRQQAIWLAKYRREA